MPPVDPHYRDTRSTSWIERYVLRDSVFMYVQAGNGAFSSEEASTVQVTFFSNDGWMIERRDFPADLHVPAHRPQRPKDIKVYPHVPMDVVEKYALENAR